MIKISTLALLLVCSMTFAQPGSIDLTFNPGAGANQMVRTFALYPNGRIVLGGDFTQYAGAFREKIAMANYNGANVAGFSPTTGPDGAVHAVAIQPSDGKIIVSGMFNNYNGIARRGIARIDSTGALDATFTVGSGFNGGAYSHYDIAIQPNGKILVGGLFTSYNAVSAKYIARLNTNGTLDATFNTGTGANAQLYAIALQSDGKIVLAGGLTNYNGTPVSYITRIDSTGAIDPLFNAGTGADYSIFVAILLPNGKILIGGGFTYFDGNPAPGIARLNSDGSFDNTFNPGLGAGGPNPKVWGLAVQPDGKIIATGEFTQWNGATANRIVRLDANGNVDATFNTGTGLSGYSPLPHVLSDGKILVAGSFTNYNGTTRNRICRINGNLPPDAGFTTSVPHVCGVGNTVTVTDTTTNFPTSWMWSVTPSAGVTIANNTASSTAITFANTGAYTIKLVAGNGVAYDSTTKNINVYALPAATATASGPITFCNGGSVQLSANMAVSYLWNTGASTQTITATQSGNYSVQVTDANGCQSPPSNTIAVLEDTIINPGICLVTVDSASQYNVIYWDKTSISAADSFMIYRDTANNNYALIGTVSFDSLSQFIDTVQALYSANGNPNVTSWRYKIAVMDTCGNIGPMSPYHQTMFFQNSSGNFSWNHYEIEGQITPVPALSNYLFLRDNNSTGIWNVIQTLSASSTAYTDPNYALYPNGSWRVHTGWTISCDPTRAFINTSRSNIKAQMVSSSIDENQDDFQIIVYPNPASSQSSVMIESSSAANYTVSVYNCIGQEVASYAGATEKDGRQTLSLPAMTSGIYLVKVKIGSSLFNAKLVIR